MDQTLRPLLIPPKFSLYAEKHTIFELYQRMLSQLIIHKPTDPLQYLIEFLKKDADAPATIIIGPPASGKKTLSRLQAKDTEAILINCDILINKMPNNLKKEFSNKKKEVYILFKVSSFKSITTNMK
jgi:adenylate kinase